MQVIGGKKKKGSPVMGLPVSLPGTPHPNGTVQSPCGEITLDTRGVICALDFPPSDAPWYKTAWSADRGVMKTPNGRKIYYCSTMEEMYGIQDAVYPDLCTIKLKVGESHIESTYQIFLGVWKHQTNHDYGAEDKCKGKEGCPHVQYAIDSEGNSYVDSCPTNDNSNCLIVNKLNDEISMLEDQIDDLKEEVSDLKQKQLTSKGKIEGLKNGDSLRLIRKDGEVDMCGNLGFYEVGKVYKVGLIDKNSRWDIEIKNEEGAAWSDSKYFEKVEIDVNLSLSQVTKGLWVKVKALADDMCPERLSCYERARNFFSLDKTYVIDDIDASDPAWNIRLANVNDADDTWWTNLKHLKLV